MKNIARKNTIEAFEEIYAADDLFAEYLGPERLAFYDEVAGACAEFELRRVIDVGCGTGHLLAALVREQPAIEVVVGVDLAEAAVRRLYETVPQAQGHVASVYDLDLGGEQFDLVLATELLEHLERPGEALRTLGDLCAATGRIVVTVPDGAVDDWGGHVNFWTQDELHTFLGAAGSVVVDRTSGGDLIGVVTPSSGR